MIIETNTDLSRTVIWNLNIYQNNIDRRPSPLSVAEAIGAKMMILMSDFEEEQLKGLNLFKSYEGFDFYPSIKTATE